MLQEHNKPDPIISPMEVGGIDGYRFLDPITETIICRVISQELKKHSGELYIKGLTELDPENLIAKVFKLYMDTNLVTFFNPRQLEKLVDLIFNDTEYRDFILDLTIRLQFYMNADNIARQIVYAFIVFSRDNNTMFEISGQLKSLTPKEKTPDVPYIMPSIVKESLAYDGKEIYELLRNDSWILAIVLILLLFDKTEVYQSLVKKGEDPTDKPHKFKL